MKEHEVKTDLQGDIARGGAVVKRTHLYTILEHQGIRRKVYRIYNIKGFQMFGLQEFLSVQRALEAAK